MAGEVTGGVPVTEAQLPAVAQDRRSHGVEHKVKATLSNAKERLHIGGHSSGNPSPASIPSPTEHVKEQHIEPGSSPRTPKGVHPACPDGGRVGDIVSPRTKGSDIPRREGEPAKPKVPHKDWGERIIEKLPFSHVNPYSVGHPVDNPNPNPYVSGSDLTEPTAPGKSPSPRQSPKSPKFMSKIKNLVTGQKATQGTATENATVGTADIPDAGAKGAINENYAQDPSPHGTGDLYDRTRSRIGIKDEHAAEKWPSAARPGATYTDEQGRPKEGPTQPVSEDTKKEGLMTKIIDKLHLNEKHSRPSSTTAAAETATGKTHPAAETAADKTHSGAETATSKSHIAAEPTTGKSHIAAEPTTGKSHIAADTATGKSHTAADTATGKNHIAAETATGESHTVT